MGKNKTMEKVKSIIPYIVAAFACLYVSFPAASGSVILDEAYTINLVRGNVSDIVRGAASDVHPPLYYLILKLSGLFGGESLFKYRIITTMGTCLNLLLAGATMIRKQWGRRVSVLYILWFGLTYSTLEKSTFVRMYSWGAFFVITAALLLFSYYKTDRRRNLVIGIVMTLAAMYTHYYALMAVFFVWLFLLLAVLIKQRKKAGCVFLGGIVAAAGYLPWLGNLLTQSRRVAGSFWMSGFDWNEWKMVPAALMETTEGAVNGVGMVLYVFIGILLLLALVRRKWDALLCAAVFVSTMIMGALLSILVTPIWATRYMYVCWGLIALFVAIVAGEVISVYSDITQGLVIVVLVITGLSSLNTMLHDETIQNTAGAWIDFLEENVDENAILIIDDPAEHREVYSFYLPDAEIFSTETVSGENAEEALSAFLRDSGGRQIWYVVDYRQQKMGVDRMRDCLGNMGCSIESVGSYVIEQKELELFRVEEIQYGQ